MRELFIRSIAALFTWFALVSNVEYAKAQSKISSPSAFTLLQQQLGGWKVDYAPSLISPITIDVEGIPHLLFNEGSGSMEGESGKPHLPVEALTLGVPEGAELRVEITDPIYRDSRNQLVAPNPTYTFTEEKEAVAAYVKDPNFYIQNRFFPQQTLIVEAPYSVRQQRMSTIRVAPYQYNPATKVLKQLVKATLNIRMVPSTNQPLDFSSVSASPDPQFENVYQGMVWNYDQAKQWRRAIGQPLTDHAIDPTRDWFETGRTYYRIPVVADGWYKVTKTDLAAAGANTSQIDVNTLKVFEKGREIPVMIRPDTTIEFYAMMNRGDSTYLDFYTDTNAYWMTWGGIASGLHFTGAPQHSGTPSMNIVSAPVTRHFEQNNWYYAGAVEQEVIETEAVPGEGWAWGTPAEWFFQNTTRLFSFPTFAVDNSMAQSRLRVRLFGTTSVPISNQARFWINDSLVGNIVFPQRTEGFLDAAFPSGLLTGDSATLKITSVPIVLGTNQFYLDWFEIDYQRFLRAEGNQLIFRSPATSGPNPTLFTVTGFTNSQIEVFDLMRGRRITGGAISGDSTDGFAIAFKDTFSTVNNYLVMCAGGQRSVLPLFQKQFADIRVNATGTDYLIISHRLFRSAAERLRAHRQSLNGIRAKTVYVDELYDEFNYGIMNATVIKNFLRHAYLNWPVPRLAYVVMFGDACWDFHKYITSTTQKNFVPSYGVPVGDNWFGCFNPDSSFLPSLLIGRLPVRDSSQAEGMVSKLFGYDSYPLGEWNKNFLFITGGLSSGEQSSFNALSNFAVNTYVLPSPIGGTPFKVYKSSTAIVDGENKQLMRNLVRDGLIYMNFLGHSGGAIWGVDIGDPNTLENTNGRLPFLSSVSCNVGAFGDPSRSMLAEEFILADNRGSIASWASSGLGYPNTGAALNQYFLSGAAGGVRDLGSLTTTARFRLYQIGGNSYPIPAMVKLNPLLGDPLSRLAIPLLPDLEVRSQDLSLNTSTPTPNDSILTIRVNIRNYGIVPTDSVGVTITDTYNGQTVPVISNQRFPRTLHRDSLYIPWDAVDRVGRHTLTVTLDPTNMITEVNEANNEAAFDQYVYANLLSVVMPLNNMVVPAGAQTLVVTSPLGLDSVGFQYFFELDTVATFDSPFRVSSGPVPPGSVSGQWITPALANNTVYFWRARTVDDTLQGNWVVSCFSTSGTLPSPPLLRTREYTKKQFARDKLFQSSATDSGVTIAPNAPLQLLAHSNGSRSYSGVFNTIRVNDIVLTAITSIVGGSIMGARVNAFNGNYDLGGGISGSNWGSQSMLDFIRNTPTGDYLAFISLFNPLATLNESLYVEIEALGSSRVRQVQTGQAWAFIGRKGYPAAAVESLTNDSTTVSVQILNYYSLGSGSISSTGLTIPTAWDSFHWRYGISSPATTARVALLGIRSNGVADTLRMLPGDSLDVSLAFLNARTSGPTYKSFKSAALLSSSDALLTPVLRDWWVDFVPPADLAVSSRTVGLQDLTIEKGTQLNLPVTVHNIGFHGADSARVVVSVFDKFNRARPVASAMLDTIPVNGTKSTVIPIATTNFSRRVTLEVNVSPSKKYKDMVPDNNNAYYTFNVVGGATSGIRLFADGVQLMDGDYVATNPKLIVRLPQQEEGQGFRRAELFVDNKPLITPVAAIVDDRKATVENGDDLTFSPQLSNGLHELRVRTVEANSLGSLDTLEQAVRVNVFDQMRIMQLYAYPNPFARDTYFTFVLTGGRPPEELSIRIFTVAGRRIREIAVPRNQLQVGFNRVYWDGRDADGDELANGYYFYQLTIKGEGKTETSIEKLAKVR